MPGSAEKVICFSKCKFGTLELHFETYSTTTYLITVATGGILNLTGATRGKLCEKSRPVRRRLSQNSFIPPRHIRRYVQWPPRRICLQEPLWSLVRPDPVDRLFSELAGIPDCFSSGVILYRLSCPASRCRGNYSFHSELPHTRLRRLSGNQGVFVPLPNTSCRCIPLKKQT